MSIRKSKFDLRPEDLNDESNKKIKIIHKNDHINPLTKSSYSLNYFNILEKRKNLPVYKYLDDIEKTVAQNQVTIIEGETGSGKTTQIPQFLLLQKIVASFGESLLKMGGGIVCTQPRRVATINVAKRVAEETDVQLGQEVGYTIRFEDMTNPNKTVLRFVTDGMLLQQSLSDPYFNKYSIIIIDEAHERTLSTDILFGLLKKKILPFRPDLRIVIMSATLDVKKFQTYFKDISRNNTNNINNIIQIPGRMYPVEVFYTAKPENDYLEAAIRTIIQIHLYEEDGDILLFLNGQEEIESTCKSVRKELNKIKQEKKTIFVKPFEIYPLYSSLPSNIQQNIYNKAPEIVDIISKKCIKGRKIIISTNIAETSLTIDGIAYVIDPGFSKQKIYNPRTRAESLLIKPISKASAEQRAGRAGRTKEGKCFRLYTEKSFQTDLSEETYPEILRSDVTSTMLTLKKLEINNIKTDFQFLDPPAPDTFISALETLYYLGAVDKKCNLTEIGHKMAFLPVDPQLAKILINTCISDRYNKYVADIAAIVAMLSNQDPFIRAKSIEFNGLINDTYITTKDLEENAKKRFIHPESDHLTLLNVFQAFEREVYSSPDNLLIWCGKNYINMRSLQSAISVRDQLLENLKKLGIYSPGNDNHRERSIEFDVDIRKCLFYGSFMQVAHRTPSGEYLTVKDHQTVFLHPSCTMELKADWVTYKESVFTTKNYIKVISSIDPVWLIDIAPDYYDLSTFNDGPVKSELEKAFSHIK